MARAALFLALAACAHPNPESAADEGHQQHPCDPKGADVAQYFEPEALSRELFPDELALRGKCRERAPYRDFTSSPADLAHKLAQEAAVTWGPCDGVCEPMRASLPALDDKHDLEDETLQSECTSAVTKLDEPIRAGCRHVCLVDRRKDASKAIFARVMLGLAAFRSKPPETGAGDGEVRRMWAAASLALPPKRFRFEIAAKNHEMKASGAFYPGGPPLRLQLAEGDAGCGQRQWSIDRW